MQKTQLLLSKHFKAWIRIGILLLFGIHAQNSSSEISQTQKEVKVIETEVEEQDEEIEELVTTPDGFPRSEIKIYRYKPFYMLYGNPLTKVQISLIASPIPSVPVFIGYTQRILWKLRETSIPIEEVQFNPDMFYRFHDLIPKTYTDVGVEHISNGQRGLNSRSYFQNFIRLQWQSRKGQVSYGAKFKLFNTYAKGAGLDHFGKYVGFWESGLSISKLYSNSNSIHYSLDANFSMAGPQGIDWRLGKQELGFKYNINPFIDPIFITLHAAFGYNETLREFDHYRRSLRFGIEF